MRNHTIKAARILLLCLSMPLILVSACTKQVPEYEDSNIQITTSVNGTFAVLLPNPGTADWIWENQIFPGSPVFSLVGTENGIVRSNAKVTFTFKAVKAGTFQLVFVETRFGQTGPEKTFSVLVRP